MNFVNSSRIRGELEIFNISLPQARHDKASQRENFMQKAKLEC